MTKKLEPLLSNQKIEDLNKEFYHNYPLDYLGEKLSVLASMYNNKQKFLNIINNNPAKIDEFEIKYPKGGLVDDISDFIELELTNLYYHSIETFLRLFLAHCYFQPCPWLELSREKNYSKFKEQIAKISNWNLNLKYDNLNEDETLIYIIYGIKNINNLTMLKKPTTNEFAAKKIKEWLIWSSTELLKVYDYNAFKHGLALYSTKSSIEIVDEFESIKNLDNSLVYLNRSFKKSGCLWEKTTTFTPLAQRHVHIFCLYWLISNILSSGCQRYIGYRINSEIFYVGNGPSVFMKKSNLNKFGLNIPAFSEILGFELGETKKHR